jgi:hypothetical protein
MAPQGIAIEARSHLLMPRCCGEESTATLTLTRTCIITSVHAKLFTLRLTMVQCIGCRQTLKNPKAYSNHQRACREYKAAGALHLRQMQLNRAKRVERAWALQLHITADEEPNELVEHTQDLNNELVVVSFFVAIYFFRIDMGI